ncbi:unnamed protein product [Cercopithifilaria johnstoni]|uniref:Uncharacterized protein n=1 Tax=Cercopithifilaria johnstoni TaxID=2874296 RepID=A0A8J2MEJ0_9BILA|nr:unnamed protein product [Cercopithifilaria johnstoni]
MTSFVKHFAIFSTLDIKTISCASHMLDNMVLSMIEYVKYNENILIRCLLIQEKNSTSIVNIGLMKAIVFGNSSITAYSCNGCLILVH